MWFHFCCLVLHKQADPRLVLLIVALAWIAAIPHPRLWKGIFVDEHALIPAGQRSYYDWGNVHKADNYLAQLEELQARNASWDERDRKSVV